MYKPQSRFSKQPGVKPSNQKQRQKTSGWEGEAKQYNDLVGERGHYYHEHVVLPKSLEILNLETNSSVLDLGCGQGVFSRVLPKTVSYVGVDASKSLIDFAKKFDSNPHHRFEALSATRPLKGIRTDFSHAVCILALQNMEYYDTAIKNASEHLSKDGSFLIVLNHPAFRIPRQSGWGEPIQGVQTRWVNRYMSHLKIPITMHPGSQKGPITMSYHMPLSSYVSSLRKHGFVIAQLEEWSSNKESKGPNAKAENTARTEFPLFMAILAKKI